MNRFNVLQAIVMAFYSPSLYRDVARNWAGTIGLYLLMLLAICWLPTIYSYKMVVDQFSSEEIENIISQFPTVSIYDGELSTSAKTPFTIKSKDGSHAIIIIDTSGTINTLDQLEKQGASLLITDKQIILKRNNEWRSYTFKGIKERTFTQTQLRKFYKEFYFWLLIILYPLVVFLSYIYRLLQALLYGALNLVLAFILQVPLTYKACIRLAMMAVTPAIIFATVFEVFTISFQHQSYFYFLVTLFYLVFGVYANQGEVSEGEQA